MVIALIWAKFCMAGETILLCAGTFTLSGVGGFLLCPTTLKYTSNSRIFTAGEPACVKTTIPLVEL
jgi:hypothetical protein